MGSVSKKPGDELALLRNGLHILRCIVAQLKNCLCGWDVLIQKISSLLFERICACATFSIQKTHHKCMRTCVMILDNQPEIFCTVWMENKIKLHAHAQGKIILPLRPCMLDLQKYTSKDTRLPLYT